MVPASAALVLEEDKQVGERQRYWVYQVIANTAQQGQSWALYAEICEHKDTFMDYATIPQADIFWDI